MSLKKNDTNRLHVYHIVELFKLINLLLLFFCICHSINMYKWSEPNNYHMVVAIAELQLPSSMARGNSMKRFCSNYYEYILKLAVTFVVMVKFMEKRARIQYIFWIIHYIPFTFVWVPPTILTLLLLTHLLWKSLTLTFIYSYYPAVTIDSTDTFMNFSSVFSLPYFTCLHFCEMT